MFGVRKGLPVSENGCYAACVDWEKPNLAFLIHATFIHSHLIFSAKNQFLTVTGLPLFPFWAAH
jgi:hypothetical protein